MSLSGAAFGAASGFLIRVYANAFGKQRYFAAPWRHVYMVAGFGYLGYYWSSWETQLLTSINKTRKERGMIEIKRQELNIAMPKVFKKEEEEPQE